MFRAFRISGMIVLVNALFLILVQTIINPLELFGDLLLIEASLLFFLAGILDFGSSLAFGHFRRMISRTKGEFGSNERKETERRALVFVASGATLFVIMVLLALMG